MRKNSCCFTGHRIIARADRAPLTSALEAELERLFARGITEFYAGGARGFDTIAAECVLRVRERLPIRLHLILPCRDQCRGWTSPERVRYGEILRRADSVRYVCEEYEEDCMLRRNDALVEASGVCVCYMQRPRGGTAYTVRRARHEGLEIIHLLTTDPVQITL